MTNKEKYQQLFARQQYLHEYRTLYLLTTISGFFFQIVNASTSFYFVYSVFHFFLSVNVAFCVALGCVLLLEGLKRNIFQTFIRRLFSYRKTDIYLLIGSFLLIGLSTFFSYKGASYVVSAFSEAKQKGDAKTEVSATFEREQIEDLTRQIDDARMDKYAGTTTITSSRLITRLNNERTRLYDAVMRKDSVAEAQRNIEANKRIEQSNITSYYFALFTLCCEFLFLGAILYAYRYRYVSATEKIPTAKNRNARPKKKMQILIKERCIYCNKLYNKTSVKRIYCSDNCRKNAYRKKIDE
jgi:hypothetical protein